MRKIGSFIVNSFVLFWSYFLTSTLGLVVAQTVMRLFVEGDSRGEYIWKTMYLYAWMLATCMVHLKATASTHKTKYLAFMKGKEWSFAETVGYTLKNGDFWANSIGFALWPVIIPKFFGVIHLCYFSPSAVAAFPGALLSVLTVSVPILLLSAVGWLFTLRAWCKNRIQTK
jgi:hypothetical protein